MGERASEVMIPSAVPLEMSVADLGDCSRLGQVWRRVDLLCCRPDLAPMGYGYASGELAFWPSILV